MATVITVHSKVGDGDSGLYLTTAGYLALITPCGMKDYISNNRRDQDGRNYLLKGTHKDDTAISVQFVCLTKDVGGAMGAFTGLFNNGKGSIGGVEVLYKNVGSVSMQGDAVVFSANLIKLAGSTQNK